MLGECNLVYFINSTQDEKMIFVSIFPPGEHTVRRLNERYSILHAYQAIFSNSINFLIFVIGK